MSRGYTDLYDQVRTIIKAWNERGTHKSYGGLSLDEFEKRAAPSGDARAEAAQFDAKAQEAKVRLKDADRLLRKYVQRVVSGVKADPEDGEDSAMYAAMGYVPRTVRNSLRGIRRKDGAKAADAKSADINNTEVKSPDRAA